jgi:glycosyltransferase involved in cell wall biosynthesis
MEANREKVSVVIPTRNRKDSLFRTIDSLNTQTHGIHEIIIIDASDVLVSLSEITSQYPLLNFTILLSAPALCAQRNMGIKKASGEYIFLLDDDIVMDINYVETSIRFSKQNPNAVAMSGLVLEKDSAQEWNYEFSKISFTSILWAYIFQLSIWSDITEMKGNFFTSRSLNWLKFYYNKKNNSMSKAGWPVLTNFSKPFFRTQVYGLGASIIKREWLMNNLYDERLKNHGIGDNYGLAINMDFEQGIFVLSDIYAYHHKELSNRLSYEETYYDRVVALHYFVQKKTQKHTSSKWLAWSLVGNFISSLVKGKFKNAKANAKLIKRILKNKNPLMEEK